MVQVTRRPSPCPLHMGDKDKEVTTTHVPRVLVGARCIGTQATMGSKEAWTGGIRSDGELSDLARQVKHPFDASQQCQMRQGSSPLDHRGRTKSRRREAAKAGDLQAAEGHLHSQMPANRAHSSMENACCCSDTCFSQSTTRTSEWQTMQQWASTSLVTRQYQGHSREWLWRRAVDVRCAPGGSFYLVWSLFGLGCLWFQC